MRNSSKEGEGEYGHVDIDDAGSVLAAAVRPGRTIVARALVGPCVVAGAGFLALDVALSLQVVEELAKVRDVGGRSNRDTALDVLKARKFDSDVGGEKLSAINK